ncbi:MAG: hypothetical protein ACI8Q1_002050, partial [Parvicella sp.]
RIAHKREKGKAENLRRLRVDKASASPF